ncbi:MAG: methyltransferase [Sedimenticola sp.]|nr:methyltransferase [Sedimenticola sp.]
MKVCTDATLFGAMAPVGGGERVLDIGTGSGLLALMSMQLGAGSVHAVELDRGACEDARNNFSRSPWAQRISLSQAPIQAYAASSSQKYDLIISNPPFFERHHGSRDPLRHLARHSDQLSHRDLVRAADRLLAEAGLLYLLIPRHAVERLLALAREQGLFPAGKCLFTPFRERPGNAVALTLCRCPRAFVDRCLVIYNAPRDYSAASARYLRPFLLRFAGTAPARVSAAP